MLWIEMEIERSYVNCLLYILQKKFSERIIISGILKFKVWYYQKKT